MFGAAHSVCPYPYRSRLFTWQPSAPRAERKPANEQHCVMTWVELLLAIGLAMFAAGLFHCDGRDGRVMMLSATVIMAILLLGFW